MKIILLIPELGSGGSEKQIMYLSIGLKNLNYDVELVCFYSRWKFFNEELKNNMVKVSYLDKNVGFDPKFIGRLYKILKNSRPDLVISFLHSANLYAELLKPFLIGSKLIVSERSNWLDETNLVSRVFKRILHLNAEWVITNSYSQLDYLRNYFWLKNKTSCIYNGTQELWSGNYNGNISGGCNLLAIGRIDKNKNPIFLLESMKLFEPSTRFSICWIGKDSGDGTMQKIESFLSENPHLRNIFNFVGEKKDISYYLKNAHALIHPAYVEGLPNVVCEDLRSGVPVICSNTADNGRLVSGNRGITFNPRCHKSFHEALLKFINLSDKERFNMSKAAKKYSEHNLSNEVMINNYKKIISKVITR